MTIMDQYTYVMYCIVHGATIKWSNTDDTINVLSMYNTLDQPSESTRNKHWGTVIYHVGFDILQEPNMGPTYAYILHFWLTKLYTVPLTCSRKHLLCPNLQRILNHCTVCILCTLYTKFKGKLFVAVDCDIYIYTHKEIYIYICILYYVYIYIWSEMVWGIWSDPKGLTNKEQSITKEWSLGNLQSISLKYSNYSIPIIYLTPMPSWGVHWFQGTWPPVHSTSWVGCHSTMAPWSLRLSSLWDISCIFY